MQTAKPLKYAKRAFINNSRSQTAAANWERGNIYDAPDGLNARSTLIKNYLESFPGGKKNQKYKEVDQAFKGN